MNEQNPPVTVTTDPDHRDDARLPRTFGSDIMRELVDTGDATELAGRDRYRMLLRYDDVWWFEVDDTFIEITSPTQNNKLDRWHRALTYGGLWG